MQIGIVMPERNRIASCISNCAGGISIMERDLDELAVQLSAETVAAVIAEPILKKTYEIVGFLRD